MCRDRTARDKLDERSFRLSLVVTSDGLSSVLIPGPLDVLSPASVRVNGTPSFALRRSTGGFCEVLTAAGRSVIEVEGALDSAESFSLQFAERPLYTTVNAPTWIVEGLQPTGSFDDALRFIRRETASSAGSTMLKQGTQRELPAWAVVRRHVSIAESTYATTAVERIGDTTQATHVQIPLLEGERITSGNIKVEDHSVIVSIPAGTTKVDYTSELPYGES